jgi:hypothetical protein
MSNLELGDNRPSWHPSRDLDQDTAPRAPSQQPSESDGASTIGILENDLVAINQPIVGSAADGLQANIPTSVELMDVSFVGLTD